MSSPKKTHASVDLEYPFENDGHQIDRISLRRMRAADIILAESTEDEELSGQMLLAALAGLDLEVFQKIDTDDLDKVTEAAIPLMGKRGAAFKQKLALLKALQEAMEQMDAEALIKEGAKQETSSSQ